MKKISMQERKERWKYILKLAWPLIIANSFWNLQLTIDRVFLGQYSTEALGAAMAVMGIFWVPMALLQQTAGYVMTFVAQYLGAKKEETIGPAVWQSLYISFIGGLLFLGLIPLSDWLFGIVGHTNSVQKLEIEYFDSLAYSALPTAIVAAISGFYSGLGQTRVVMGLNAVGLIGNVVFDYLLIFGNWGFPQMGIAGAGYATAIATWMSAFYGFYLIFQNKNEEVYKLKSGWRWQKNLIQRFLKFGIPSGLQWALEGLAFTVFLVIIGRMPNGAAGLASSSIAVTIMMLSVLPTFGMAQAVSVLVGQHLGSKTPEQAHQDAISGLQVAMMYIAAVGVTFLLFPKFYLNWFYNPEDAALWSEVSFIVPYLLMFVAVFTLFDSMNLIFSFTLKGAGDTRFVSLVALTVPWPIMVLPTWLMKDWDGAVFWSWGAASIFVITQSFVYLFRFLGGKWKTMSVIN